MCKPGRAGPVRVEVDADTETPVSAFLTLSHDEPQAFLLESVEGGERSARFSFLGAAPRSALRWKLGEPGDPIAAIRGERGSGVICINGAAAHLNKPGDLVILASFAEMEESEARAFKPTVVRVDHQNRIVARNTLEVAGPARRARA